MIVSYDIKLVVLSMAVAMLGAHAGLTLLTTYPRNRWLSYKTRIACAAVAIGTGIWAMHFIGMLALHLPVSVDYAVLPTLISELIAIMLTGLGLYAATCGHLPKFGWAVGACMMGLGISIMHYTGMEAVRAACLVSYSYPGVFLSVLSGIGASGLALWFATQDEPTSQATIVAAVTLGLAISSMHYIAMLSTQFAFAEGAVAIAEPVLDETTLACTVAVLTFLLCDAVLLLTLPPKKSVESDAPAPESVRSKIVADGLLATGLQRGLTARQSIATPTLAESMPYEFTASGSWQGWPRPSFRFGLGRPRDIWPVTPLDSGADHHEESTNNADCRVRIAVTCNGRTRLVDSAKIVFVRADGHYAIIYFEDESGKLCEKLSDQNISKLAAILSDTRFFRVHRSYLANLSYVRRCSRKDGNGELILRVSGAPQVPVSRTRFAAVQDALKS